MPAKPTRPCQRCYASKAKTGPHGQVLQYQAHPGTWTVHRVWPTWADVRGWGFWALCGVPIVFWKPAGLEEEK